MAILAAIPVIIGGMGVFIGPALVMHARDWPVNLDSHFRFLSGIFLAIGLAFYWTTPGIERKSTVFRLAGLLIFTGGIGRAISLFEKGPPVTGHLLGLASELVLVPLLVLWQARVARTHEG